MRLTVIGSTGRTGLHLLDEGVRRGHRITAFTRRPHALADPDRLADVVTGDGRDPDAVRAAVEGADAVIAIVSAPMRKGPHHAEQVAGVLVRAMSDAGVRRLVVTSAYPIVGTRPRLPIAVLRLLMAEAYADTRAMERVVANSDLDWTIARPNRLIDKPARGGVTVSSDLLDRPTAMTRADAAAALLDIAENRDLARTAVNLCGRGPN